MHRNSPLYRLARDIAKLPIDWDNPMLARFQYEMRHDYVEHMHTLELITTVVRDEDEGAEWITTLTEIMAQPEQRMSMDAALGHGRC